MFTPEITAFQTAKNSRIRACNAEQDQVLNDILNIKCYFGVLPE